MPRDQYSMSTNVSMDQANKWILGLSVNCFSCLLIFAVLLIAGCGSKGNKTSMDNVPSSTDNDVEVFSPARQWPKLPDVEDCDQIELHVEPTLLTYRFPGIDEPGLFNNKEMLQLKSWKTVTVRDTNDIGHIALQIQSRPHMWSPHVLTNLTTLDKG